MTEIIRFRRERYMQCLNSLLGSGTSAMVTGMRGCGKSVITDMFALENRIDVVDLTGHGEMDAKEMGETVSAGIARNAAVVEGVTDIPGWEDALEKIRSGGKTLFVTCPYDGEYSRVSGTPFGKDLTEVRVRPLSFAETVDMRDEEEPRALLYDYLHFGGMPAVVSALNESHTDARNMMPGMMDSLIAKASKDAGIRDVDGVRAAYAEIIRDTTLRMSPKELSKRLTEAGWDINMYLARKYAKILRRAFLFDVPTVTEIGEDFPESRYEWYLPTDIGLRSIVTEYDVWEILRNAVYKEMVYRDPNTSMCRMGRKEVGFMNSSGYVQTSDGIYSDRAKGVISVLKKADVYPKTLVTENACPDFDVEGIEAVKLRAWLFGGL